jgi:hypothetical protein
MVKIYHMTNMREKILERIHFDTFVVFFFSDKELRNDDKKLCDALKKSQTKTKIRLTNSFTPKFDIFQKYHRTKFKSRV